MASHHRVGAFLLVGCTRQRAASQKLWRRSLRCSAIRWKKDESDLNFKVSENIMAAGSKYLKGDREALRENLRKRNYNLSYNFDRMLKLYAEFKVCRLEVSELRHKRNVFTKQVTKKVHLDGDTDNRTSSVDDDEGGGGDGGKTIELKAGVDIKQSLKELTEKSARLREELLSLLVHIPNSTHPDVPEGDYSVSRVVCTHGSKPEFSFPVLDHMELGQKHDIIDFGSSSTISGRNFYFLKGAAAMLEMALLQYAMQKAISKGYHPVITPDIIKDAVVTGCGFDPKGQGSQVYRLVGYNKKLCLSGTAEMPMAGMFVGDLLPLKKLPLKFVGFGRCFRAETGGYGQATRGLYRVHQFSKVELFSFTANETGEESEEMLGEMVALQKEIAEELGLHFRVLEMSTQELGASAYHKYDLEVWMPGREEFGEVCSASNCTDYQSMRLKTVYHNPLYSTKSRDRSQPPKKFVHTVNATALAVPRIIVALLENFQQEDGSVVIPEVLHPFLPPDYRQIRSADSAAASAAGRRQKTADTSSTD